MNDTPRAKWVFVLDPLVLDTQEFFLKCSYHVDEPGIGHGTKGQLQVTRCCSHVVNHDNFF